jgi:hypothetical protein
MIHLWYDPEEKVYGLKRVAEETTANSGQSSPTILRPKEIEGHGTVVVLLGKSDDDNTMEPPAGTADAIAVDIAIPENSLLPLSRRRRCKGA